MGIVLRFPRAHKRASSSFRAANAAKTSRVISDFPSSAARDTTAAQWPAGMPRVRQLLTVESDCAKALATAPVPPRATMIASEFSMEANIVRKLRTCQGFATCETTIRSKCDAIGDMDTDDQDVAKRLIAVRKKLGFTSQVAFAEKLDLTKSTYNPFETGERPLSMQVAKRIRVRFGISVDYLLFGDIGQPKEAVALELGPKPSAEPPAAEPRRRQKARAGSRT